MKKLLSSLLILLILFSFMSCAIAENTQKEEIDIFATTEEETKATLEPQKSEIVVFADSAIYELMESIKQKYESNNKDVRVICKYDASKDLKNQIINLESCDVFVSSDADCINQIDISKINEGNIEVLDFIEPNTRNILFNNTIDTNEVYEVAVIRLGHNVDEAIKFTKYLTQTEAKEIYKEFGYNIY